MDGNWEEAGGFPAEREGVVEGEKRGLSQTLQTRREDFEERQKNERRGLCGLRYCVATLPLFQPLKAEAGRDCETLRNISASICTRN